MNSITRIIFLFILIFSFCSVFPVSGDDTAEETEIYSLEKENWTVGMPPWEQVNLLDRQLYLPNSLPQLLKEELKDLSVHVLSDKEAAYLKQVFLDEKLKSAKKELESLFNQRDKILFSSSSDGDSQYKSLTNKILKQLRTIEYWKGYDPSKILVDSEFPIELVDLENPVNLKLMPFYQEKADKDMIITGRIERLEELIILELKCFVSSQESPVFSWSGTDGEEGLNGLIVQAARELRTIILGRSWSQIDINTFPQGSLIKLNGETIGVGTASLVEAEPGFVTVTVSENGYITDSRQVYLPPMENTVLNVELQKGDLPYMYFLSEPPGASVYYGSLWMGETPLHIARPSFNDNIRMTMEGYQSFNIPSYELEGETITVKFSEKAYSKQQAFKDAKKDFYKALGWFSLSMGAPLILYGIYQNQVSMYYDYAYQWIATDSQESYDKAQQYERYSDITYYSFLGGIALSGTLFVNTILKLRDYIKAAETSTED